MDHPNAALVRRMTEHLDRGEWDQLSALVADDVVWHEIGRAEPRRGKTEMLAGGSAAPDYEISYALHDVVANDDHTVALGEATATRGGRTLKYRTAEIFHIRDGQIQERWAFSDDTAAIVDFFK